MATILVGTAVTAGVSGLFMQDFNSRRVGQRARTVSCSTRGACASDEVLLKPDAAAAHAALSTQSMRKGESSCPPAQHAVDEVEHSPTQRSVDEPDPEPDRRNAIDNDDDRMPFCNLQTDYSPSYSYAKRQAQFLRGLDVDPSPRQYYRTPSPLRQHAGIGTDCAYMQQAAFFPVAPVTSPFMLLQPTQAVHEPTQAVNRTPSPCYGAYEYCVPELPSLANFLAPRALPTVELPMMVAPCSPVGEFMFSEPSSVMGFVPPRALPTMVVPSCPGRDFTFTFSETNREPALTLDEFLAPIPSRTSVLLRNLPAGFTRSKLLDVLHDQGLALHVDFAYVPGNLKLNQNCGYAFVNFTSNEAAEQCLEKLEGFIDWGLQSESVCEASWCSDRQGLDAHMEHYKNSRIMHPSVDDEYKPAVFHNGARMPFPPPSKIIRAPRLRKA